MSKCTSVLLLAAAAACCLALAAHPARATPPCAEPPNFSWDTVPVFMHAMNESGPLNATAAAFMAQFPIVTIEKSQGQSSELCPPVCNENTTLDAARMITAVNASARVLLYINSIIAFKQYHLVQDMPESELLHDENGKLVHLNDCAKHAPAFPIFDHRNNATRARWLATVAWAMEQPEFSGIFADRARAVFAQDLSCVKLPLAAQRAWDAGHRQLLQDAMSIVRRRPTGIIVGNGADLTNGRMFENFSPGVDSRAVPPIADMEALMRENSQGRLAEVHSDRCSVGSAAYNQTLAAYLIGAQPYNYYWCSRGWTLQTGWDSMSPDYLRPLGAPTGNATRTANGWARAFASGTKVTLDTAWAHPCIEWADGHRTGCI